MPIREQDNNPEVTTVYHGPTANDTESVDRAKALAAALETNTTITSIEFQTNFIGADGAAAIAKALEINKTLTSLLLYGNSIGTDGAKAIAKTLETNQTITSLSLGANKIDADGAKALADAIKENFHIHINYSTSPFLINTQLDIYNNRNYELNGALSQSNTAIKKAIEQPNTNDATTDVIAYMRVTIKILEDNKSIIGDSQSNSAKKRCSQIEKDIEDCKSMITGRLVDKFTTTSISEFCLALASVIKNETQYDAFKHHFLGNIETAGTEEPRFNFDMLLKNHINPGSKVLGDKTDMTPDQRNAYIRKVIQMWNPETEEYKNIKITLSKEFASAYTPVIFEPAQSPPGETVENRNKFEPK